MKKAILLVTFGTSISKARAAFDNIQKLAKEQYPDVEIRWAYTAKFIRRKLAKQGIVTESPLAALSKLSEDGFSHVAVQSLHMIPGFEFDDLKANISAFQSSKEAFEKVTLGTPLLYSQDDLEETAEKLIATLPKERTLDDAVIFIGHGTGHYANMSYLALAGLLHKQDKKIFIGVVEGEAIDKVLQECQEFQVKKAWLIPLMSVAGDHAVNDIAGDDNDSWKSTFKSAGIKVETVLSGIGENKELVKIWLAHLSKALEELA